MGNVWKNGCLYFLRDAFLYELWRKLFIEVMVKGNKIYDDLFDVEVVDFEVEEVVLLVDLECGIYRVG